MWNQHKRNKHVQFLLTLTYISWEAQKKYFWFQKHQICRSARWFEKSIFLVQGFSYPQWKSWQGNAGCSVSRTQKDFSESSHYLIPLRKAKIIHYEKYVVFTIFLLCFGPNQSSSHTSDEYNTNCQLGQKVKRAGQQGCTRTFVFSAHKQ